MGLGGDGFATVAKSVGFRKWNFLRSFGMAKMAALTQSNMDADRRRNRGVFALFRYIKGMRSQICDLPLVEQQNCSNVPVYVMEMIDYIYKRN